MKITGIQLNRLLYSCYMNWLQYLWDKLPELKNLGNKDLQLSKLVARIHRKRSRVVRIQAGIDQIQPLHAIDRDTALQRLNERVEALKLVQEEWLQESYISNSLLNQVLPSVSAIKVIRVDEVHDQYVAFEGNGRLYALKQLFNQLEIEIDLYEIEQDKTITRRVKRVLQLNKLLNSTND